MAGEKREVKAVLDLSLGPEGEKSLRQLTEAIGKADVAFQQLKKSAASTGPKVIGPMTGAAAEAMARATPPTKEEAEKERKRAMRQWGWVGFSAGVGTQALSTAGTAASAYGNPYMTGDAQSRAIVNSVPVASQFLRIAENLNQRGNKLEAATVQEEKYRADIHGRLERGGLEFQYGIPQAGRERLARATEPGFRGGLSQYIPNYDRDTTTGERAFREESRLLPIRREMAKATRELSGATAERVKAEKVGADLYARQQKLEEQRIANLRVLAAQEEGRYPEGMSKEDREKSRAASVLRQSNIEDELQGTINQRKQAAEAVAAAKLKEGGIAGRVTGLSAELLQARSEQMGARAETYAASGARLGAMNPYERQFGVQALKALQQYGPDAIGPQMLAAAQQVAPETARKAIELHGRGTAEYEQLKGLAPTEFGDVKEMRGRERELAKEAEDKRRQQEAGLARVAAEAGRDLGAFIGDRVLELVESAKREIDNRLRVRDSQ